MFTLTTLSNKTTLTVRYWLGAMALLLMCSAGAPVWATDTPPGSDKSIAQRKETGHWNTDGHWYFYWQDKDLYSSTVLYRIAKDLSDLMLLYSNDSGWWINQNRAATADELAAYSKLWDPVSSHPLSACPQIQVERQWDNSPSFNDPTNERVIVRDREGHVIRSFVILEKINPPGELDGVLREDHQDPEKTFLLPFIAPAYPAVVLADCSLIMKFKNGIIRFDTQGQTQAVLPQNFKIVDGQVMDRLQKEFETSEVYQKKYEESLDAKLAFYYHKLFEPVGQ